MRAEWFIWLNLNFFFFNMEMITCVFHVSKELLNPGEEDSTVCSCY